MQTVDDPQVQYLLNYINQCWENRQYYKDEQSKLLYWIGGTFTAVVAATGILGAIQKPDAVFMFLPIHAIIFHVMFLIAWYFLLYKQLNADMYEFLGTEAEKLLKEKIGPLPLSLPPLYGVKGHYLGKFSEVTRGRNLVVVANVLSLILYLGVVTSPLWRVSANDSEIVVSWGLYFRLHSLPWQHFSESSFSVPLRQRWLHTQVLLACPPNPSFHRKLRDKAAQHR